MNLEESKTRNWGGPWTEEKLDTFEKYVLAYLTIMNAYRDKYGWKITYFDGFAGSGERTTLDEEYAVTANLFGEDDVTKADLDVYTGAAERVVRLEQKGVRSFDQYCFVEKNDKSRAALIERLDRYPTSGNKEYFQGDANDILEKFAINLSFDSKHKALIFLDPFGMQLKWETIKKLGQNGIDLWLLIPTGVIINRLLNRDITLDKELIHSKKLSIFFGMSETELIDFFYETKQEPTLFELESTEIKKKQGAIEKIARLYVHRLKGVFKYVTETPLVMYNNHNVPIFHFAFASMNKTAVKIAQQIIDKKQ